jgi:hypothetical protein
VLWRGCKCDATRIKCLRINAHPVACACACVWFRLQAEREEELRTEAAAATARSELKVATTASEQALLQQQVHHVFIT